MTLSSVFVMNGDLVIETLEAKVEQSMDSDSDCQVVEGFYPFQLTYAFYFYEPVPVRLYFEKNSHNRFHQYLKVKLSRSKLRTTTQTKNNVL